ncbi:hypothetical protein [Flavobacterium reichenbachii]|uniref:DUF304 domain-containing protein n=1 Tax=Flavobacterium reichenbachii TaxID=362418 RepID=A0A085ZPT2_9FLAO|nr:hypothetical protein [Flavobacterium reichenbachii]KFF06446.1 hypothetical protein IW19_13395 [Flavobacterium reichenbachii]OXB11879.1 hypothetical protein B0A68_20475 [Flavobacterium reichenbachii]
MEPLQKFTKIENQYVMKRQHGFGLIVVLGMAAFAFAGLWFKNTAMIWIFGILTVLCLISIFVNHVVIDISRREIIIKNGLMIPPVQIPFDNIVNFELVRMKQYFITINVSLNLYYLKNEKEQCSGIAQGLTTRSMQNLLNEIQEILKEHEHSGTI